tara:strand:+ start:1155 stop:1355 length:201 start_codon:yes stop_codon:yes gene_type:complete
MTEMLDTAYYEEIEEDYYTDSEVIVIVSEYSRLAGGWHDLEKEDEDQTIKHFRKKYEDTSVSEEGD